MAIACLFVVVCALAGARAYNEVQDAVGGNILTITSEKNPCIFQHQYHSRVKIFQIQLL